MVLPFSGRFPWLTQLESRDQSFLRLLLADLLVTGVIDLFDGSIKWLNQTNKIVEPILYVYILYIYIYTHTHIYGLNHNIYIVEPTLWIVEPSIVDCILGTLD